MWSFEDVVVDVTSATTTRTLRARAACFIFTGPRRGKVGEQRPRCRAPGARRRNMMVLAVAEVGDTRKTRFQVVGTPFENFKGGDAVRDRQPLETDGG